MKFGGKIHNVERKKWLKFGGDPDYIQFAGSEEKFLACKITANYPISLKFSMVVHCFHFWVINAEDFTVGMGLY